MKLIPQPTLTHSAEVVIISCFEEDQHPVGLPPSCAEEMSQAFRSKIFTAKFGEIYSTIISEPKKAKVLIIGLGKKKELTLERVRRTAGKIVTAVKSLQHQTVIVSLPELLRLNGFFTDEEIGRSLAEGFLLGDYTFEKYLSAEKKKKEIDTIFLVWTKSTERIGKGLKLGRVVAEAANCARDLVNDSASVITPAHLEKTARDFAKTHKNITVRVLNKEELQKEGLNLLLGVSAGSYQPPKLILIEYRGDKSRAPIVLVGKGITFDSGGYNLKPTKSIEEMKTDMAGAAAVLSIMGTAAELGLHQNIIGVIPACENMIGGGAQRPGDIVRAYNGKNVEIGNTDAEGRLILADAIAYAEKKYQPKIIIDLATLTGACVVALGYYAAGLVSPDEQLSAELREAGDTSGDRVWSLPFYEEYQDWMNGTISDLINITMKGKGYEAGAVLGAVFL